MAIELLGYRGWQGELRSPWLSCWPMVRTGVWLVLRRKIFWLLLALGLLNFLFTFAIIYAKAELSAQNPMIGRALDRVRLTGTGEAFHFFMTRQEVVTMLLLAFAGSMLIGSDYQQSGLTFYLSRRLGRRHYVLGKLLAIECIVLLITTLPALILYLEYGLLSRSMEYFQENWRILLGILGYGLTMAVVLSTLLCAVAAWVPRAVPLVMTWSCIFVLLPVVGENLRYIRDNRLWRLVSIWHDLDALGRWCFGAVREREDDILFIHWSAVLVPSVVVMCLLLFVRRVRAVEVVR